LALGVQNCYNCKT